ncbi:MAG: hypothetical protein IJ493_10435 [Clostridia bacterium]|nr:hypothetical protein [Clostridia bacterium]
MIDWKKLCKTALFPPLWMMIILTIGSAAALVLVFVKGLDTHPIAYVTYVLAFYTLTVDCIFCSMIVPKYYRAVKQKVYANKYGNRYFTDVKFKTHVSLYMSLTVNLLYVATNLVSGILYHSLWFGILAGYYAILAVMRFLLVRFVNRIGIGKNQILEYRRSRLCGMILMMINLTLSGAVLMMMYQNRGYEYQGILIYVMAMYTFYVTTSAIVKIIKYRKYCSPVMSTTKIISLSAALVSMLSLETAMLTEFGKDMSAATKRIMIAATGAGVSVIVVAMSVYTIVRACIEIRKLKNTDFKEDRK